MTEYTQKYIKAVVMASGHNTTEYLPYDWPKMVENETLYEWLDDHVLESNEYVDAEYVWDEILSLANLLMIVDKEGL